MQNIQQLFQSEDGNIQQRENFLSLLEKIVSSLDELKNPNKTTLGPMKERSANFYQELMQEHQVPTTGIGLDQVVQELTHLMQGHPYHTRNFVTNVLPMASIPGVLGQFTNALLNGNNL